MRRPDSLRCAVTMVAVFCLGLLLLNSAPSMAGTINVPIAGNSTIQSAINLAANGDTVLVAAGTYHERINFGGKNITVRSASGAAVTTINGDAGGSVVTFANSELHSAVLDGFTITNGTGNNGAGGGIYCPNSSPTITNCAISGNTAADIGGGIFCLYSSPAIINCTVSGNTANWGGGIYYGAFYYDHAYSSSTITNCVISGNMATNGNGGGIFCEGNYASPAITNCTIRSNTASWIGGGIWCNMSSPAITNCTISGNTAAGWAGGGIFCAQGSSPAITNCTIYGNTALFNGGGICCYDSSSPTVKNSIFWGDMAAGNPNEIDVYSGASITVTDSDIDTSLIAGAGGTSLSNCITGAPLFVNPAAGDFHLQPGSPGIDAANSDFPAPATDKDGNPRYDDPAMFNTGSGANGSYYDMGAYENQPPSDNTPPAAPVVTSSTHPNQTLCYSNNTPAFNWTASDASGIAGYSWVLDQSALTSPARSNQGLITSVISFPLADGVWYFHVRAVDNAGNWGATATYRVQIDTHAPSKPVVSTKSAGVNNPMFTWWAIDPKPGSGIGGYNYKLDHNPATDPGTGINKGTSTSKSYNGLAKGTWYFHIRAVDKSHPGNWGTVTHFKYTVN